MNQEDAISNVHFRNADRYCHDIANAPCTLPGRVVTRQDSCALDVSLDLGEDTWPSDYKKLVTENYQERLSLGLTEARPETQRQISSNLMSENENVYSPMTATDSSKRDRYDNLQGHEEIKEENLMRKFHEQTSVDEIQEISDAHLKDSIFEKLSEFSERYKQQQPKTTHRKEPSRFIDQTLVLNRKIRPHFDELRYIPNKALKRSRVQNVTTYRKYWTTKLIMAILLFGLIWSSVRLQGRVDHLENTVQRLSDAIQKCSQTQVPSDGNEVQFSVNQNIKELSTSESFGFIAPLVIHREDPENDMEEYEKTYSALPLTIKRENTKIDLVQGNDPAVLSDHVVTPETSSVQPEVKQYISDSNVENNEGINSFEQQIGLASSQEKSIISNNRFRRSAKSEEELIKFCLSQVCKKKKERALTLPAQLFIGDFYHVYDYKKDFTKQFRDCFVDTSLPTKPYVCKEATVLYPHQDSSLGFYRPVKEQKKKACDQLLELVDFKSGNFRVRVPGIYALNVNITMVLEKHTNHSVALFLNGHAMLACPNGGFRCPRTNEPGSFKYRICNMHGIFELLENDHLQIRTLEDNTVIRIENHRQSQFKAILLHQMSETSRKKKC
ncbi:hypothetical protein BgiMline_032320 [Biomphalaria glabrata]|uniref:Uncharacterized protein LOC106059187 n=1 Tax=Biomphalaria glabrata TaxID=6526 RepID=A0A9W2YZP8_BIOGL|nr:uncharacterized protein LOC106059187 [Biomphalaria glabrata]KAI8733676.1 hypothetical protein BgiMline_028862 [Biomphalaria glabrata]